MVSNLVLRASRLSGLRLPRWLADAISHSLGGSLLESCYIIHLDFLATDPVFSFFLILTVTEAEWVIVGLANRARVNRRQWLPFAGLGNWRSIFLSTKLWRVTVDINVLWRTALKSYFTAVKRSWSRWGWLEEIWVCERAGRATSWGCEIVLDMHLKSKGL